MLRHPGRFTASLAAGFALLLAGCGGGSDETTGDIASADPAPPPAAAPAEPAPPPPGNSEEAAPEAPGSGAATPASSMAVEADAPAAAPAPPAAPAAAPAMLASAPEAEAPAAAPAAPVAAESSRRVDNATATDDLLQLAQAAIASPSAGQPAASSSSSSATGEPGMPGEAPGGMASSYGYGPGGGPPTEGGSRASEAALRQGYQAGAPGAMPGEPGGSGSLESGALLGGDSSGLAGGASANEPDYSDAIRGAQTFLAAVQSKDVERIADAVALRSVSNEEGSAKYKKTFQAILDRSVDPQVLDEIYEAFKDMKIVGTNNIKSSGSRGVIVGHQNEKQEYITRTITMRREKTGWKVLDFSGFRVQRMANTNRNYNNQRN